MYSAIPKKALLLALLSTGLSLGGPTTAIADVPPAVVENAGFTLQFGFGAPYYDWDDYRFTRPYGYYAVPPFAPYSSPYPYWGGRYVLPRPYAYRHDYRPYYSPFYRPYYHGYYRPYSYGRHYWHGGHHHR